MKKAIILLTLILVFAFIAACGNEPESPTQEAPVTTEVQETPVPTPEPEIEEVLYQELDGLAILQEYLGVAFIINPVEVVWNEYRWQFLELYDELDIDNFPGVFGGHLISVIVSATEEGDVLIVTCPEGNQYLHINQGGPAFYVSELDVMVELEPTESLSWAELARQEREAAEREAQNQQLIRFGMTFQYSSEHIDWFSTDENARFVSEMAEIAEARLQEIVPLFGFELPRRINVWYFCSVDFYEMFPTASGGFAIHDTFKVYTPYWSTALSNFMTDLLVHEVVHVVQWMLPGLCVTSWGSEAQQWIFEGTATYFERYDALRPGAMARIVSDIRRGNFITIDNLEENFWEIHWETGTSYAWAESVIQFVVNTWGFDYVVEMHRRPMVDSDYQELFGVSRNEFEAQWHQWLIENYG